MVVVLTLVQSDNGEDFGAEGCFDKMHEEVGETADAGNTNDEGRGGGAFPPSSIGQSQVVFVIDGTLKKFTDNAENIDGCDYNRAASSNGERETKNTVTGHEVVHTGAERADED